MTRKIVLLFLILNISLICAQEPQVQNDVQKFHETIEDESGFFENKKQAILRLYLATRRTVNPFVVNFALVRCGIKDPKTKMVAHAVVNSVTHIAVHKALDPELKLRKLIPGALLFAGAEAAKEKANELLEKHVTYSISYPMLEMLALDRLIVDARSIWDGPEISRQKFLDFLKADQQVSQRFKSDAYSAQVGNLKTSYAPADLKVIINSLKRQNERKPRVGSIANALSAAQSLLHYEQGIVHNIKDVAICYAKGKIEAKIDEPIDWAIEYIQK